MYQRRGGKKNYRKRITWNRRLKTTTKKRIIRRRRGQYSAKRALRDAAKKQSDLSLKLVSTYIHMWESKASNNNFYVEEICPFKRESPFWTRNGGLLGNADVNSKRLYVRGGEWRVTMTNLDNSDAIVNMYLGFCKDGTDYRTMAGDVAVPWSPFVAKEDIGRRFKISTWRKQFVLKRSASNDGFGEVHVETFKIGTFPVDVNQFINEKKGWPFLWVTWRGVKEWHVKCSFALESMILFTDNQPHGLTTNELQDLQNDIRMLKAAMYTTGDAQMT